jgi:hypothetical protein
MLIRAVLTLVPTVSLALAAWRLDPDDLPAPRIATATIAPAPNRGELDEYVGTKRCRMCHSEVFRSWSNAAVY